MALITLQNIYQAFGGHNLLDGVTLQIEANERICLVGRNGEGKSTFLKITNGDIKPDKGEILTEQGLKIGFLQQELPLDLKGTIESFIISKLPKHHDHWEAEQIAAEALRQVGLTTGLLIENLSGGQARRALLAAAIADKPNLLLLDEPTNHLDIPSISWMEGFLMRYPGTILFISHDRAFLRKLATRIVELDRGKISSWECDYSTFLRRRQARLEEEEIHWNLFDKKLAQEEAWIRQGIKARRTRNEGRVKALEQMRRDRSQRRERQGEISMNIHEAERSGQKVITAKNVSFQYPNSENIVIPKFDLSLARGDKLAIIGANGCGKSTLIKLLIGKLTPNTGEVLFGTRLEVAYFDQSRHEIDDEKTVAQNLTPYDTLDVGGNKKHVISYLQDFLFAPDRARQQAKYLSGGERNRLLLAKLFATPSNLLIMDEPTNDLDAETLELLEELLVNYSGTIIVVSHDREFLNNVATSTLVFESEGTLKECVGGYDDYLKYRNTLLASQKAVEETATSNNNSKNNKPTTATKRKLTFKETRELESLPELIEKLETELAEIHEQLTSADFYKLPKDEMSKIVDRNNELPQLIEDHTTRWIELESIANQ